jgi:hypothetical protein
MDMDRYNAALAMAGVIGSAVAMVHGVLTQRLVVEPLAKVATSGISVPIRKLVPALLHFSTFNWFIGGLALLGAAYSFEPQARLMTGLLVGSSYLFGATANLWATRGRHPGWMLYAIAVILIVYGLGKPGVP